MILSPSPVQQFFDNDGNFLVGGLLFTYEAATVTKQACFTDSSGNTALPNPIVLNARGEVAPSATGTSCGLWMNPILGYKLVLAPPGAGDPPTSTIWTVDQIVSPQTAILAQLASYMASLGGVAIGTILPFGGATLPPGYLLCYGQAISRTTYGQLFAAIGTAFGDGDASTTFNVPDLRGRYPLGADNMGGSPANRVTQAVSGILATTVGQTGGDQNAQADTLTSSSTSVSADAGHQHGTVETVNQPSAPNGTNNLLVQTAGGLTAVGHAAITTSTTTTTTSSLTGASQNMPPVQVVAYMIFSGV